MAVFVAVAFIRKNGTTEFEAVELISLKQKTYITF